MAKAYISKGYSVQREDDGMSPRHNIYKRPRKNLIAMDILISWSKRFAAELGVHSIAHSTLDTKLLCLSRFIRLFAYGTSTLILALFLSSVGISDARIGGFMSLTLLGDVVISFVLTLVADQLGRRRILQVGAALMCASGIVFSLSNNYWILVTASILGVISPR